MTEQECARRLAPLLAKALARADATRPVVEIGADTPSVPCAGFPTAGELRTGVRPLVAVSAPIPATGPCPVSARPAGPVAAPTTAS